jgi:hypothetical protein
VSWARSAATHDMTHGGNGVGRYGNFAEGFLERRHYFSVDNVQSRHLSVLGLSPLPPAFIWPHQGLDPRRGFKTRDVVDDQLVEQMKKRVLELDYFGLIGW